MAAAFKHHQYFRRYTTSDPSTLYVFTSVSDAQTRCGFHNTFLTSNSPTVTYALEDSGQTLKTTHEFGSKADQDGWLTAIKALDDADTLWRKGDIQRFKMEWLHEDGSVSASVTSGV